MTVDLSGTPLWDDVRAAIVRAVMATRLTTLDEATRIAVSTAHSVLADVEALTDTGTVHAYPPMGESRTLCCGETPFNLPRSDRLTVVKSLVTCEGRGK